MNTYEAGIIGGGPAGLLTALLLARRGIRCAVFERKPELSIHPKAIGISRRTAEIFQQIGIRRSVAAVDAGRGPHDTVLWAKSLMGEELGRTASHPPQPDVAPYDEMLCPQHLTEQFLLEALDAEKDASIFFEHDVRAIHRGEESVHLDVHRTRLQENLAVDCKYVVAADGAGSFTRHALGITAEGPGDLGHFVNTYFRAPYGRHLRGRKAVLNNLLSDESFEVFVSVDGSDLWLMHHFLQPGENVADFPGERLIPLIRAASGLPDVPVEILGVTSWVMSPKIASAFRAGRIFLTGDAAARLSPAGGLGMNTGLQSAHNLAWKLAAVLRGAPDSLLDTYESERRAVVTHVYESSNALGGEVFEILSAGFSGDWDRARDLIAQSRRTGSGLGRDLGFRYTTGAFVPDVTAPAPVNDDDVYAPAAIPGARAPHVWLDGDGARVSILDFFGRGFVVLAAGDAAAWRDAARDLEASACGFALDVVAVGGDEGYGDPTGNFLKTYRINPGGAVLVRPDGITGWTCPSAPKNHRQALDAALVAILAGGPQAAGSSV